MGTHFFLYNIWIDNDLSFFMWIVQPAHTNGKHTSQKKTHLKLYQNKRSLANFNGTIDTKVVPFFCTHKMPKIRTFCYEKKHLKNGFPFLWRAENKQRNEWVRATKRMSKGCIFLDLPFLWSKKRFFTEKSLPIGIYLAADFLIYTH